MLVKNRNFFVYTEYFGRFGIVQNLGRTNLIGNFQYNFQNYRDQEIIQLLDSNKVCFCH